MVRRRQTIKSRMGGARQGGGPGLRKTRKQQHMHQWEHVLPPPMPLFQHNTAIDANKYLCRAQMPQNCRTSKPKQSGLCCACHCTERRWRRKSSGLLTTTGIGSSDTIQDNEEGFPALPFSGQLVQDDKREKGRPKLDLNNIDI